jgi:Na+/melibiose symporter-like transporter
MEGDMTVYDPEPKIPTGDLGHGLSLGGLLLTIFAIAIWVWIPPPTRTGSFVTVSFWLLLISGIVLMICGHFRKRRDTDSEDEEDVTKKTEVENRRDAA